LKELKDSNSRKHLENTYLKELMEFVVSSYHNPNSIENIGLKFLREKTAHLGAEKTMSEEINSLRNIIMHHSNISGETEIAPHNFQDFKSFFIKVLVFRSAWEKLSQRIQLQQKNRLVNLNNRKLEFLKTLSDKELKEYFYGI
jgi:hypothetical protein